MENNSKADYKTPTTELLEVLSEGNVCVSGADYNGFGEEEEW